MKIARVRVRAFALPLVQPLRTARGKIAQREGYLVELESQEGVRGWGEALPLPTFGGETLAACGAALAAAAVPLLESPLAGDELPAQLDALLAATPVARGGCEMAVIDLVARDESRSAARALGSEGTLESLPINALLVGDSPEALEQEAHAAVAAGYETLKLKLGGRPLSADVDCARAVRRAAPAPVRVRLDANGAWSEVEAERALRALAQVEPEWVEQPISPGDVKSFARLHAASAELGVPIAADESAAVELEIAALLDAAAIDALVIKLPTLGGPRRARQVACLAQSAGVEVAVTSFLDSTLGIAAAARVAASLPARPAASGLATARLLADDLAEPWRIDAGCIWPPQGVGFKPEPEPERIARLCGKTLVDAVA